ncbi:hypothetical protein D1872_239970 [compost metagenome]
MVSSEGEDIEIKDDLAIVDANNCYATEKIAFLAEGDSRKLAILKAWTYQALNDSDTAILLAQNYGGNTESHRRYVTRFKSRCQKALAHAV